MAVFGAVASPRKTSRAWLSRAKSASSIRPMRWPIFDLGTVVILSTIRLQVARRPFSAFGRTTTRSSGASVWSVVKAQIVMESVPSNRSS